MLITSVVALALVALVEGFFLLRQSGLTVNLPPAFEKALTLILGATTDARPVKDQFNAQEEMILQETAEDLERMQNQINRLFHEMTRETAFGRRNPSMFNPARNPFVPMDNIQRLQSEIARIFQCEHDSRHGGALDMIERDWRDVGVTSSLNMEEDGTNYVVTVSVPGFEKDDINLSINNRVLTIEAVSAGKNNAQNPQAIQSGRLKTQIMLPGDITGESAQAVYKDGVLKIMVPKKPAGNSLARKVTIM